MAKHNNANWDRYKLAGREHPGEDVQHEEERQKFAGAEAYVHDASQKGPHIPNQERASQPAGGADEGEGDEHAVHHAQDPQNISGSEDVAPTLSDDEGMAG